MARMKFYTEGSELVVVTFLRDGYGGYAAGQVAMIPASRVEKLVARGLIVKGDTGGGKPPTGGGTTTDPHCPDDKTTA